MYARRDLISSEEKLKESVFFVEANDNERHQIWRELHEKHEYEHDNSGCLRQIGNIKGDPNMEVWVSFSFSYLNGYRICMYYATSRYVDHTLVTEYLEKNYPVTYSNGSRKAMCDAGNYRDFVWAINDMVKQKAEQDGTTA